MPAWGDYVDKPGKLQSLPMINPIINPQHDLSSLPGRLLPEGRSSPQVKRRLCLGIHRVS